MLLFIIDEITVIIVESIDIDVITGQGLGFNM